MGSRHFPSLLFVSIFFFFLIVNQQNMQHLHLAPVLARIGVGLTLQGVQSWVLPRLRPLVKKGRPRYCHLFFFCISISIGCGLRSHPLIKKGCPRYRTYCFIISTIIIQGLHPLKKVSKEKLLFFILRIKNNIYMYIYNFIIVAILGYYSNNH